MATIFDPKKIAFAVITSYPKWYAGPLRSIKHTHKVRGDLALEFFQKVSEGGFRAVCADGQSSKSFRRALGSIPNIAIIKRKVNTSGQGKRLALHKIAKFDGVEAIVLCEPEKVSFVTDCLTDVVQPILENKADIVVPKREEKLFQATYPDYMYTSEVEGNRLFNEALKSNGILNDNDPEYDHFFGPRVFRNDKKVLALFMRRYTFIGESILASLFDPEAYSNLLFFPVVAALKKKMRIVEVTVPFRYPKIQKENESVGDREAFVHKRVFQRINILADLMHFLTYLQKKRSSKLRSVKP